GARTTASMAGNGETASVRFKNEGAKTLTFSAKGNAGNVESTKTLSVKIDKTAPTAGATVSPTPNAAGWNNTNVTVTLTGADTGSSGLKTLTYSINGGASTDVPAAQLPVIIPITTRGPRRLNSHAT